MNKEEIKKIVQELTVSAEKLRKSLEKLEEDVKVIEKGDVNGSYWNGNNAYDCMKTTLLQLECDRDILKSLEKDIVYLESLVK